MRPIAASTRAWEAIVTAARHDLRGTADGLTDRAYRIARRTHAAVERADERLATRATRLRGSAARPLDAAAAHLDRCVAQVAARPRRTLDGEDRHLGQLAARVALLDPVNQLARGWSITRGPDGRVVRSAADVAPGAVLRTQLADGTVTSRVEAATPTHEDRDA